MGLVPIIFDAVGAGQDVSATSARNAPAPQPAPKEQPSSGPSQEEQKKKKRLALASARSGGSGTILTGGLGSQVSEGSVARRQLGSG